MEKRCWLCYDLGIKGKYQELYEWLDNLNAVECGDDFASFVTDKDRDTIVRELAAILDLKTYPDARIYIIHKDAFDGKVVGRFVIGRRKKQARWTGSAFVDDDDDVDEG